VELTSLTREVLDWEDRSDELEPDIVGEMGYDWRSTLKQEIMVEAASEKFPTLFLR